MKHPSSTSRSNPIPALALSLIMGLGTSLSAGVSGPSVTATKDDGVSAATKKPGGSTVTYTNTISNATGTSDATGMQFLDPDVTNTTYVSSSLKATPVAIDDTYPYTVIANTSINTATSGFSVVSNDFAGYSAGAALSATNLSITSVGTPLHGSVSIVPSGASVGQFTYTPAPGYTGPDSFTYVIDNTIPGGSTTSRTGTVYLTIGGPVVWFVDPAAGINGNGSMGSPFNNLASAATTIGASTGQRIFIYTGGSAQSTGITLNQDAWLVGQASTAASFDALMSITYPADTPARPSINNATKPSLTRSTGNTVVLGQNNTIRGLAITNTAGGYAISGTSINTVTIGNDVSLTSSSTSSGVLSLTGGGNGNITLGIPITSNAGRSINIANRTGGTVSINALVTDNGSGISLTNNGGATINFTGGLSLSTGANTAFSATGGGTVTATQNNSTIINTITNTTATALNVSNTTIGSSGLTFRSINSNGGTSNGIILDTTGSSGGLTVTGDGSNTALGGNSTGGTIQNKSGSDGSTTTGNGIYLNNTSNVVLRRMTINGTIQNYGIQGYSVNNLTMEYCTLSGTLGTSASGIGEGAAYFGNPLGATGVTGTGTVTSCNISGGCADNFSIHNTSGTLNRMTITGSTFGLNQNTTGNDSLAFEARNSGTILNTTVTNCTFTGARGDLASFVGQINAAMDVVFQNNTCSNNHAGNIIGGGGLTIAGFTSTTFNVSNNTLRDADGSAITLQLGAPTSGSAVATSLSGTINNNQIGVAGVANSGSKSGNGIFCSFADNTDNPKGLVTLAITNNIIRNYSGNAGIYADNTGGAYDLNLTCTGNTTAEPGASVFAGLALTAGGPSSTDDIDVFANITNNNFSTGDPANANDIIIGVSTGLSSMKLAGTGGPSNGTPFASLAAVQTFLLNNNNTAGTVVTAYADAPATFANFLGAGSNNPPLPSTLMFAEGGIEPASTPTVATTDAPSTTALPASAPSSTPAPTDTGIPSSQASISQADLDGVVSAAIERWTQSGLTQQQIQTLQSLKFEIAGLTSSRLGEAGGDIIRIDASAGGKGWFVDSSAPSDEMFASIHSETRRHTTPDRQAAGRVDLLTTIMHEMGHALGLPDTYDPLDRENLMFGRLTTGERRTPEPNQARGFKPSTEHVTHFLTGGLNPINIGTLPAGKSVVISYDVQIDDPFSLGSSQISSQATISGSNFTTVLTNDPETATPNDATITLLDRPDTTITSIARTSATPTKNTSVSWTVTFANPIAGLTSANFSLAAAGLGGSPAITSVTATGATPATTWTVTASTGTGQGSLGLNTANDTSLSHDVTNMPVTGAVYQVDMIAPTVAVNQALGQNDPANTSPVNFTAVFSEAISGFTNSDVSLSGTAGATTATVTEIAPNDGTTYNIAVSGMTGQGTIVVSLASSVVNDPAGNLNTASTSTDNSVSFDNVTPTVSLTSATGDPTTNSAIPVTAQFSETVTGFSAGDIVTGNGSVANFTAVDGDTYTFDLVPSGPGVVTTASIPAGAAKDAATNDNTASLQFSRTIVDAVGIAATTATAAEGGATGLYTFTRASSTGNLTVSFQLDASSTASAGTDFNLTSSGTLNFNTATGAGTIVIPGGQLTATVTLTALAESPNPAEAAESARLNVVAGSGYVVGTPTNATVTITENSFLVTTTADSGNGSLRQAVLNANSIAGTDTVTFDSTIFATPQTITLGSAISLASNLSIQGPSAVLTISGGGAVNLFNIAPGNLGTVTLSDLILTNGNTAGSGGALNITNGTLNLIRSQITGCTAGNGGGAIFATSGTVNIVNSSVTGNTDNGTSAGGAISGTLSARVNLRNSTVSGNNSPNAASNSAGGISSVGILDLRNSTITNNSVANGSGNAGGVSGAFMGTHGASNTIIAGNVNNSSIPDIAGSFFTGGNNLIGNLGTATNFTHGVNGDQVGTAASPINPQLAALANNGGRTLTHALLSGSPALNAGNNSNIPTDEFDLDGDTNTAEPSPFDQRGNGYTRAIGTVDIGAFELQKSVSILADASNANEGTGSGNTAFTFTISRTGSTSGAVTMNYAVTGTGANPANAADFGGTLPSGTVTIPDTQTSTTLTINVSKDGTRESNEGFSVALSNPDNGFVVQNATATSTINNDDFEADLSITATDGVTTKVPGTGVTYTITASNAGPDASTATIADTFPASLSNITWTAIGAGGGSVAASGNGNINESVTLPVGGSVTFTVSATVAASATGSLANTATVTTTGGVTDPIPGNNSATDTDTLTPQADLAITKTDGVSSATPGASVTYTITVSNAGPSNATAATVADTLPATIASANWTAVTSGGATATASGSGNINDTVNLPAGASITYTVNAAVSPSATGSLSNTATIVAPASVTDTNPGNNSATDTDTLNPSANLAITVTDGVTTAVPGSTVTYTITATNAGPSNAPVVTVADTFPAILSGITWTGVGAGGGTGPASGSGNINATTIALPAGSSFTFTVNATVSASATGTLSNTATISSATADPVPANNSATDTDTLTGQADLAITKTDGATTATPSGSVTYTITASNAGPSNVTGATVTDTLPATLTGASWTAAVAGGATATASGSGNISDTVNLPAGGSITYTVNATVSPSATGSLSNTATVSSSTTDPVPGNNSATDTDTLSTVVSIASVDADADENTAGTGTWRVTRNGTSGALTVHLAIDASSTASASDWTQSGATFASLIPGSTGTVTIPNGQASADITLTPSADVQAEAAETVRLNLAADSAYTIISPSNATVTIGQNDFVVVNTNDNGEGSLRQALLNADAIPGTDTVTFAGSTFTNATAASPAVITLTTGQLSISSSVNLKGTGAQLLHLSGNNSSRVLSIASGNHDVSLENLTIRNGATTDGLGVGIEALSSGALTIKDCSIRDNTLTNVDGTVEDGAGIFRANGTLTMLNCTISGNQALSCAGGGIALNSTTATLTNCTISGNTANQGAGVYIRDASANLTHCTVAANSAGFNGGGIFLSSMANVTLANTIVAGNTAASRADLSTIAPFATLTSLGGNLIGNNGGTSLTAGTPNASNDWVGSSGSPVNPQLGTLADNGGPTLTHALLNGSPAINAGIASNLPADTLDMDGDSNTTEPIPFDQRGNPNLRLRGTAPDSGAIEAFAFEPTISASPATDEDTQTTSGLVISKNSADGGLTTHYRITGISGGTLYQNDGTTAIAENEFITTAQGAAGLRFTPGLNLNNTTTPLFGFTAQAAVGTTGGDLRGSTVSTTISVTPVNDAPVVVAPGIPDQTVTVGTPVVVALGSYLTDVDLDTLTYSVTNNTDPGKATSVITGGTNVTLTALAFGQTDVTIQASDGNGGFVSDTFRVFARTPFPTAVQPVTTGITVNTQTGLYQVPVHVTNTTAVAINGFRLHVDYGAYLATYPSLRLYNATSPAGSQDIYVDYPFPVAVGASVQLNLAFYTRSRTFPSPFVPGLSVQALSTSQVPDSNGNGVQPRLVQLENGTMLLEFPSVAGRWYRIRYSADLANWQDCPVPIQATTNRMQWIDNGAPFTDVPPSQAPTRFYRVNEINAQ